MLIKVFRVSALMSMFLKRSKLGVLEEGGGGQQAFCLVVTKQAVEIPQVLASNYCWHGSTNRYNSRSMLPPV